MKFNCPRSRPRPPARKYLTVLLSRYGSEEIVLFADQKEQITFGAKQIAVFGWLELDESRATNYDSVWLRLARLSVVMEHKAASLRTFEDKQRLEFCVNSDDRNRRADVLERDSLVGVALTASAAMR
jgi:hypothetical protein